MARKITVVFEVPEEDGYEDVCPELFIEDLGIPPWATISDFYEGDKPNRETEK